MFRVLNNDSRGEREGLDDTKHQTRQDRMRRALIDDDVITHFFSRSSKKRLHGDVVQQRNAQWLPRQVPMTSAPNLFSAGWETLPSSRLLAGRARYLVQLPWIGRDS